MKQPTSEDLARAALRGFFQNESGFEKMDDASRKRAIRAVEKLLQSNKDPQT